MNNAGQNLHTGHIIFTDELATRVIGPCMTSFHKRASGRIHQSFLRFAGIGLRTRNEDDAKHLLNVPA